MKEIEKLACMSGHYDGAHWGVSDWYPEIAAGIQKALKRGKNAHWTTGWYSSKKEIASACITHANGEITCEVGVSDDFDTEGRGSVTIPHTTSLRKLEEALDRAFDEAHGDKRDNEVYLGFCVRHNILFRFNRDEKRKLWRNAWVETYLVPIGDGHYMDQPPGDNYHKWGFQGDRYIPKDVKRKLSEWAESWTEHEEKSFTYKGWTIEPWKD